jgi:hypothetical protein
LKLTPREGVHPRAPRSEAEARDAIGPRFPRSYPQARPPGNDCLGLDALDDDELLATRGPGHEADGAPADAQLIGEQLDQRLVRRATDGRRRDMGAEDAVDRAIDVVRPGTRSETDGKADVGVSQGSAQRPVDRVPEEVHHAPESTLGRA